MLSVNETNRLGSILQEAIATIREQGNVKYAGKQQLGGLDLVKNKTVEYNNALADLVTMVNNVHLQLAMAEAKHDARYTRLRTVLEKALSSDFSDYTPDLTITLATNQIEELEKIRDVQGLVDNGDFLQTVSDRLKVYATKMESQFPTGWMNQVLIEAEKISQLSIRRLRERRQEDQEDR